MGLAVDVEGDRQGGRHVPLASFRARSAARRRARSTSVPTSRRRYSAEARTSVIGRASLRATWAAAPIAVVVEPGAGQERFGAPGAEGVGGDGRQPDAGFPAGDAIALQRDPGADGDDRAVERLAAHDLQEGRPRSGRRLGDMDAHQQFAGRERRLIRPGEEPVERDFALRRRRTEARGWRRGTAGAAPGRRPGRPCRYCRRPSPCSAPARSRATAPPRASPASAGASSGVSQFGDRQEGADLVGCRWRRSPARPGIFHRLTTWLRLELAHAACRSAGRCRRPGRGRPAVPGEELAGGFDRRRLVELEGLHAPSLREARVAGPSSRAWARRVRIGRGTTFPVSRGTTAEFQPLSLGESSFCLITLYASDAGKSTSSPRDRAGSDSERPSQASTCLSFEGRGATESLHALGAQRTQPSLLSPALDVFGYSLQAQVIAPCELDLQTKKPPENRGLLVFWVDSRAS